MKNPDSRDRYSIMLKFASFAIHFSRKVSINHNHQRIVKLRMILRNIALELLIEYFICEFTSFEIGLFGKDFPSQKSKWRIKTQFQKNKKIM